MSKTPETDAQQLVHSVTGAKLHCVDIKFARKLERELRWAKSTLWETYWLAFDLQRSADAYVDGYNDSEDKKRVKLARNAFKKLNKKIKKEGKKFLYNKNPET